MILLFSASFDPLSRGLRFEKIMKMGVRRAVTGVKRSRNNGVYLSFELCLVSDYVITNANSLLRDFRSVRIRVHNRTLLLFHSHSLSQVFSLYLFNTLLFQSSQPFSTTFSVSFREQIFSYLLVVQTKPSSRFPPSPPLFIKPHSTLLYRVIIS